MSRSEVTARHLDKDRGDRLLEPVMLGDLDPYPRTDAPVAATPSFARAPFDPALSPIKSVDPG